MDSLKEVEEKAPLSPATGLILAGGRARRFGRDKALVEVDRRPMVERVFQALHPLVDRVYVSVRDADRELPVGRRWERIVDVYPDAGPLAGIHAGLLRLETQGLLVAAVDMPFIETTHLAELLACRGEVQAVVARDAERVHPLCGCYHRSALEAVEGQLAGGRYALRDLLERLTVRTVLLPAEALRNINRPDDLETG